MDDENLPVQCHPPIELKKKKKQVKTHWILSEVDCIEKILPTNGEM